LAPLAQDLLSAPLSEAYVERVFPVCGELQQAREISLEKRIILKIDLKFYA